MKNLYKTKMASSAIEKVSSIFSFPRGTVKNKKWQKKQRKQRRKKVTKV